MDERAKSKAAYEDVDKKKIIEGFVVMALECLAIFNFQRKANEFKMTYLMREQAADHCTSLPLCAMSILADYKNQFFKQGNVREKIKGPQIGGQGPDEDIVDVDHSLKHLILTGHKDGKILIWRL